MVDRPMPEVGEDGVLIRVVAAGLNSLDWRLTRAEPAMIRLSMGLRAPRDERLGEDVSGIVTEVGPAVTQFAPGDAVFGQATGSIAEYVVAHERHLAHAPSTLPLDEAAALSVAGVTALQAIRRGRSIGPGSRVLVIGAAGGVGSYCVQIAASLGAHVTGVCSTASVDYVRRLGAHRVIDYRTEKVDGEYDLIVELAVGGPLRSIRRLLAPEGVLVLSAGDGGALLGPLPRMGASVFSRQVTVLSAVTRADDLRELARLAEAGSIAPVVVERFPLERAAEAIARVDRGFSRGKVLVEVGS